jgi:hypothetical protein
MLTRFGVSALSFMMLMYALEKRGRPSSLPSRSGVPCRASTAFWREHGPLVRSKRSGQP